MKIKVAPKKLLKLIRFGSIGSKSPLLNQFIIRFDDKTAKIRGFTEDGYVAFYGSFGSKWFREYEAKSEDVILKTTLLGLIEEKFNDEESIEISTDEEMLWIRSPRKEYHELLRKQSQKKFPIEMVETKLGIVPEHCSPLIKAHLEKDELFDKGTNTFGSTDILLQILRTHEKELTITTVFDVNREFKKTLRLLDNQHNRLEDIEVAFQREILQRCLEGLDGKLWLLMDNDIVIISEKGKDYSLTYMIRASSTD